MEAKTNSSTLDSLGTSVSKAIDSFRISKVVKWVVIGILILGVLGYLAYKAIKKSGLNEIPLPELPEMDKTPIADEATFKLQAELLAKQVKEVTSGWLVAAGSKEGVFRDLYKLDDRHLIYVYRVYTTLYFKKDQESMTQAIEGEWNYIPEWQGGVRTKLINRLTLLGAK
ncbi:hypothetical protein [Emticicia sp. BO119]|uniref:hypothetical protein n=1 Tax=Emticicia sp. BO119 TaxID=2757768 RepID=UPI0015F0B8F8|nr:hypothetical protein [Emticicia sp. BO119]MBA4849017.1 hypothetical protein [Emticicia sp. BO119]